MCFDSRPRGTQHTTQATQASFIEIPDVHEHEVRYQPQLLINQFTAFGYSLTYSFPITHRKGGVQCALC